MIYLLIGLTLLLALVVTAGYRAYLKRGVELLTEIHSLVTSEYESLRAHMSVRSPLGASGSYPILESYGVLAEVKRGGSLRSAYLRLGEKLPLPASLRASLDGLYGGGSILFDEEIKRYEMATLEIGEILALSRSEAETRVKTVGVLSFALALGIAVYIL